MANTDLKRVGLVLSAEGAEDFQKTLKNVNSTLKENQNEFRKAKASYDESTSGLTKLKDSMKFAQAQAETYGDKVTLLKGKLADLQKAEKDNFSALSETKEKTEQLRKELEELTNAENADEKAIKAKTAELEKSEKQLKKLVDQENDYNSKIKATKSSLDDATIATEKYAKEAEQMQKKIESGSQGLEDLSNKLDTVANKMKKTGDDLTKGITVPVAGVVAGSMKAWESVDEGLDIIIKKTGATGDAFLEMKSIYESMARETPFSFEDIGEAIGEVNTRFNLTGDALKEASTNFLKYAEVNGVGITEAVDSIQKSMDAYGVDTDRLTSVLDVLTKAGQDTGVDPGKLASTLVEYSGFFRQLGMDYESSVYAISRLEMAGADAGQTLSGLQKAWTNSTKANQDYAEKLASLEETSSLLEEQKALVDGLRAEYDLLEQTTSEDEEGDYLKEKKSELKEAESDLKKLQSQYDKLSDDLASSASYDSVYDAIYSAISDPQKAQDLFGSKLAPKITDLFEQGILDMDLFGSVDYSRAIGSLQDTYEAIKDPSEELKAIVKDLTLLGYDLGETIGPVLVDIGHDVLPILQGISDFWKDLSPETQDLLVKIALIAAAIGPILSIGGAVIGFISGVVGGISELIAGGGILAGVIEGVIAFFTGPVGIIALIGLVIAGITAFLVHLYKTNKNVRDFIDGIGKAIGDFFYNMGDKIVGFIEGIVKKLDELEEWGKSLPENLRKLIDSIKLPTISIEGSLDPRDWVKQGLPSLKLKWMAEGGILNHPTIFGAGEAGAEAVMPLDTLHAWITDTNAQQTSDIIGAMENACFRGFSKALQAYKPGVYLDDDKVGEIFSDMLAQTIRRA